MRSIRRIVTAGLATLLFLAWVMTPTPIIRAQEKELELEPEGNYGVGNPDVFVSKYLQFRKRQLGGESPDVLKVRLGYVKGLSRSFTGTAGEIAINLQTGTYQLSLSGLTPLRTYSVSLVQKQEDERLLDKVAGLITFVAAGTANAVSGVLPVALSQDFTIDRVVVKSGLLSTGETVGAGTVSVFQKIFFRRLSLMDFSRSKVLFEETTAAPRFARLVPEVSVEPEASLIDTVEDVPLTRSSSFLVPAFDFAGGNGGGMNVDQLISKGAKLFFEETFKGNGRSCGTCHPGSNNFTIDPGFISSLPPDDPLFVAEFNPALAQLERPQLMRQFGLILENVDGLDNPANKFVMRSVPHTLGLQVSLEQDTSLTNPPADMTGWSGDGAPGTGSLREFAIGAVVQHATKSLARIEGQDFKLPNENQLDAMEAFQLSLGRSADFNLAGLTFNDVNVEAGKSIFVNGTGDLNAGGKCANCHGNAGAIATNGQNRNFNTNVEDVANPARLVQNFPLDGGFGQSPTNPDGSIGNRTFNAPPVVEAADTGGFFHNNITTTLDGVMEFYTGPEFNNPRAPTARFAFTPAQKSQVVGFMRGINTLQNVDVAVRELDLLLSTNGNPNQEQMRRLETAYGETQDAIDVLSAGGIFPSALTPLSDARGIIQQALQASNPNVRRSLAQSAMGRLTTARSLVAN